MLTVATSPARHLLAEAAYPEAKWIYFSLLDDAPDELALVRSRFYLARQLDAAKKFDADVPQHLDALSAWIDANSRHVGFQYGQYLKGRKEGAARRYFTNKSHALYFLKSVAPTKLVDGAWLYGLVRYWRDERFSALIRIYLEELGEGIPEKNHVVIFGKLVAAHGCNQWKNLCNTRYIQGAIQLSLAHHAADFLPETIGFNLGYEQLPLHLLICAYELNELGIDPYYFTLHVTVDNVASGHAKQALQGLFDALPGIPDRKKFFQRVINGYKLNLLGASTNSIIEEFDLRQELLAVFATKRAAGAQMHSDYCRIAGKTVNQWLSDPAYLPAFLDALEQTGWIKRHRDPENSRFWKLMHGEHAEMFGVFNAYERQVVYDWIAGDSASIQSHQLTYKATRRRLDIMEQDTAARGHSNARQGVIRNHFFCPEDGAAQQNDFNMELRLLEEQLASFSSKDAAITLLTRLMSPANHHTSAGLMATRIFTTWFNAA